MLRKKKNLKTTTKTAKNSHMYGLQKTPGSLKISYSI